MTDGGRPIVLLAVRDSVHGTLGLKALTRKVPHVLHAFRIGENVVSRCVIPLEGSFCLLDSRAHKIHTRKKII
jgi:hypothetical protein